MISYLQLGSKARSMSYLGHFDIPSDGCGDEGIAGQYEEIVGNLKIKMTTRMMYRSDQSFRSFTMSLLKCKVL